MTYYYATGRNSSPTTSGFCTTVLAAVINAIDSSRLLFATARDDAERVNASPIPAEVTAKLFDFCYFHLATTDHSVHCGGLVFRPASRVSSSGYITGPDWIFTLQCRGIAKPFALPQTALQSLRIQNIFYLLFNFIRR